MTLLQQIGKQTSKFSSTYWVIIVATFINQLGNMVAVFLLLYLNQQLHFTLPQASFIFATFGFSALACGMAGGACADRFGAAPMMLITLCLNGLTLLIMPLLQQYWHILVICLLWGGCYGIYRPASQTLVSMLAPNGMQKLTFSIYRLGLNLGMSIGPVMGGYLANVSFTALFIVNGSANLIAALIMVIGLKATHYLTATSKTPPRNINFGFKWLAQDATLRLFLLGMLLTFMVFFQSGSTLSLYLSQNLHFSLHFYGFLFTISTLLIVCCEIPLNVITQSWSPQISLALGSAFIAVGFGGYLFATKPWHAVLLTVLWTIGEMLSFPSATSYIAEISPVANRGAYMALYSTSLNLGNFIGPWAGALIMHHFSAAYLWTMCLVAGVGATLIFMYLHKLQLRNPTTYDTTSN